MNRVALIGRLGQHPKGQRSQNGTNMAFISLGVNRIGTEGTDWIDCVAFGKTAELIIQYCVKGDQLGIDGRLSVGKDGNGNYRTNVIIDRFDFCAKGKHDFVETEEIDCPFEV